MNTLYIAPPEPYPISDCTVSVGSTADLGPLERRYAGIDHAAGPDSSAIASATYSPGTARITIDGVDVHIKPGAPMPVTVCSSTPAGFQVARRIVHKHESYFAAVMAVAACTDAERAGQTTRTQRRIIAMVRLARRGIDEPAESEIAHEAALLCRPRRSRQNRSKRARGAKRLQHRVEGVRFESVFKGQTVTMGPVRA